MLYLHHAVNLGYKNAVVRTPDTDILVILLYHAHTISLTIYLDTGSGKHRKLINLSDLAASLGESYCETLLGFYVFTGEDCTSSFKGKGKVAPLKKLEKNPRFHKCFQQLGDDWNVNADVLKEVEKFTCLMYGQSRETSVDGARVRRRRETHIQVQGRPRSPSAVLLCSKATCPACESSRCVVQTGTSSNRGETKAI